MRRALCGAPAELLDGGGQRSGQVLELLRAEPQGERSEGELGLVVVAAALHAAAASSGEQSERARMVGRHGGVSLGVAVPGTGRARPGGRRTGS